MEQNKKYLRLSEFLLSKNPDIDLVKAKEAIMLYWDWTTSLRGGLDGKTYFCAICRKQLTDEEVDDIKETHFNLTCTEHIRFRNAFNTEYVRKQLGIKLPEPFDL